MLLMQQVRTQALLVPQAPSSHPSQQEEEAVRRTFFSTTSHQGAQRTCRLQRKSDVFCVGMNERFVAEVAVAGGRWQVAGEWRSVWVVVVGAVGCGGSMSLFFFLLFLLVLCSVVLAHRLPASAAAAAAAAAAASAAEAAAARMRRMVLTLATISSLDALSNSRRSAPTTR